MVLDNSRPVNITLLESIITSNIEDRPTFILTYARREVKLGM